MAEEKRDSLEIKLPELPIEWTEENGRMVSNEIKLGLGILGEFSLGPLSIPKEVFQDEKESTEHEAHVAFTRLLCRFAALAVVELDLNPNVLVGWYSLMKEKKTGDTQYYVLPEE